MDFALHIWAGLWATMAGPIHDVSATMAAHMLQWVRPNMKTATILVCSLSIMGAVMSSMGSSDFLMRFLPTLVGIAVVTCSLLTLPIYTTLVINLVDRLPASMIAAVTGTPPAANWAAALDTAMIKSMLGPSRYLEGMSISVWSPQSLVVALLLAFLIVVTGIAYALMFFINVFLALVLALLVGFGPVPLAMAAYPKTRGIAVTWAASIGTTITAMVLLAATTTIIVGVQDKIAFSIFNLPQSGPGMLGGMVVAVSVSGAIYLMFGLLALASLPIARTIFNGALAGITPLLTGPAHVAQSLVSSGGSAGGGSAGSSAGGSGSFGSSFSSTPVSPPGRPMGRP